MTRNEKQPMVSNQPSGDRGKDESGGVGRTLRDATYEKLNDRKSRASDTLGSVAGAVRGMTEPLRDGGQNVAADYVTKAADGIDRWAHQLRERQVDDAIRAVNDFARRQPVVFLGLALGAGALLARFLKSSTADTLSQPSPSGAGWGGGSSRDDFTSRNRDRVSARGAGSGAVATSTGTTMTTDTTSAETPRISPDLPTAGGAL